MRARESRRERAQERAHAREREYTSVNLFAQPSQWWYMYIYIDLYMYTDTYSYLCVSVCVHTCINHVSIRMILSQNTFLRNLIRHTLLKSITLNWIICKFQRDYLLKALLMQVNRGTTRIYETKPFTILLKFTKPNRPQFSGRVPFWRHHYMRVNRVQKTCPF